MPSQRSAILAACALILLQAVALWTANGQMAGALLSGVVQLLLGVLCVRESVQALDRSTGGWRRYWRWLAATFGIWVGAQSLGIYIDASASRSLNPLDDLLFFCSGIPFGMLLFLDSEQENDRLDRLHLLDFLQICAFWVCVYLYFSRSQNFDLTNTDWGPFGWSTSLVFNGVVALSFVLRALAANSPKVREVFGLMALYLFLSGLADSYFSFAPNTVESGSWFDLIWSGLLMIPLFMAATWRGDPSSSTNPKKLRQWTLVNQFFSLLYPFFSLMLIAQMAEEKRLLSTCIGGVVFMAVGVRVLIIQGRLIRAQERLQFEATHDALTGLANRRAISEILEKELERQKRTGDPVGVIMADADHFKKINDNLGHSVGDQVLREVAQRMKDALRSYDWVGRYGGEEFLIVVPNCDGNSTFASAERLRKSVTERPVTSNAGPVSVTLSMGVIAATGCTQGLDSSTLLRLADEALYTAKANGRNRVEGAFFWGTEPEPISNDGDPALHRQ